MNSLLRYWNTVRYLKPIQVYSRLRHSLFTPSGALESLPQRRLTAGTWHPPVEKRIHMTGPTRFELLNITRDFGGGNIPWEDPGEDLLWTYQLHYFDDLNGKGGDKRKTWHQDLINRWVLDHPRKTKPGWDPYPLSLRIVNWIKWDLRTKALNETALESLALQAEFLSHNLETHLLGNHLLANAKALIFAGCFFEGLAPERWLRRGLRTLDRQLKEQILGDGGHFELSPMYQGLILEDILDLCNLAGLYPALLNSPLAAAWKKTAGKMLTWLEEMCHPDGDISFFNDACLKVAPEPEALRKYAESLDVHSENSRSANESASLKILSPSGYARLEAGPAVVIADVGKVGPDYLPAHAHADTLSFEMSLGGKRFLVNSGTGTYWKMPDRLYQRGTEAHNTVVVNGRDSSEVWSRFRTGRRAKPVGLKIDAASEKIKIICGHDGYRKFFPPVTTWRQWIFTPGALEILDTLEGGDPSASAFFHFHPEVTDIALQAGGHRGSARLGPWKIQWETTGNGSLTDSRYCAEFNRFEVNKTLKINFRGRELQTLFKWSRA